MKILHTVEFYSPSVGGAQEVVKQLSERLAARGHSVTVATTRLKNRESRIINGVKIEEFAISGNAVDGIRGEVERYQRFLVEGNFDVIMNYAAQQWSMDLVFPVLEQIPYRKVMIPCGFSAFYRKEYQGYFERMPQVMRKYDHLVFHASQYRDIDLAHRHGMKQISIIPNGADEREFQAPAPDFRSRYGIPADDLLLLTIGSHNGQKGHHLCLEAFQRLKQEHVTLVIAGNTLPAGNLWRGVLRPFLGAIGRGKFAHAREALALGLAGKVGFGCLPDCRVQARRLNSSGGRKRVLLLDPPRQDVVAALQAADLFIFGSNIEYSPLVLFEAMAAGTPFLSLACGNAAEIVAWGGGGRIAATRQAENGLVDGDSGVFGREIDVLLNDPRERTRLARAGQSAARERFTWDRIVLQYENLYSKLLEQPS